MIKIAKINIFIIKIVKIKNIPKKKFQTSGRAHRLVEIFGEKIGQSLQVRMEKASAKIDKQ